MLGGFQLKLIAIGLLAAAIAAGWWRLNHVTGQRDSARIERDQSRADYSALRGAYEHERKIAKEASDGYANALADLQAAAVATPTRSVRLCRSPTGYVPAGSPAPEGISAPDPAGRAAEAGRDSEAGPDIGAELYALADEWDKRAAQCNSLIRWTKAR